MRIPALLMIALVGLVPIAILASLVIIPQNVKWQPPVIWKTEFGTQVTRLSADKTGPYVVGFVGSTQPGQRQVFLKKFGLDGSDVWTQQFGNPSSVTLSNVSVGSEGLYVSGLNNSLVFVEKHDFNGSKVWRDTLPDLSGASGVSASSSGLYVAGSKSNSDPSIFTVLLKRFDSNGSLLWTKFVANVTQWDNGSTVLVYADPTGVYMAFSGLPFISRYDLGGGIVWTRQFDLPGSRCVCHPWGLSSDGSGIYVGGSDSLSPNFSFLRKYDSSGNLAWANDAPTSNVAEVSASQSGVYTYEWSGTVGRYDGSTGHREWGFIPQFNWLSYGLVGVFLAAEENSVYLGGSDGPGLLVSYSRDASLILFGINPPYSFIVPGTVGGAIALLIVFKKKPWKKESSNDT